RITRASTARSLARAAWRSGNPSSSMRRASENRSSVRGRPRTVTSRMMHPDEAFARIPEGWFQMGSDDGADDERPVHRVWIDAFELAVYPVTCGAYELFLRATGHEPPRDWPLFSTVPDRPVV